MSLEKKSEVSSWWNDNPQTYGDLHGTPSYGGTQPTFEDKAFFETADRTFYQWAQGLHDTSPFDRVFPFERYRGKRVLEVGCGMGAMSSLWARHGAQLTAVDLAPFSVHMTRRRFELFGLDGCILEADGRELPFDPGEFDYVYSWGVLHHSPDLTQSLAEMMRVLKPGGEFGLMLYHRHSLFYGWRIRYREGFIHNEARFLNPLALASRYTDASESEGNPHTWPVTKREVEAALTPFALGLRHRVLGPEVGGILGAMLPGLDRLPVWLLKPIARRWGWSLWTQGMRSTGFDNAASMSVPPAQRLKRHGTP